jgi:hypothetical protein
MSQKEIGGGRAQFGAPLGSASRARKTHKEKVRAFGLESSGQFANNTRVAQHSPTRSKPRARRRPRWYQRQLAANLQVEHLVKAGHCREEDRSWDSLS